MTDIIASTDHVFLHCKSSPFLNSAAGALMRPNKLLSVIHLPRSSMNGGKKQKRQSRDLNRALRRRGHRNLAPNRNLWLRTERLSALMEKKRRLWQISVALERACLSVTLAVTGVKAQRETRAEKNSKKHLLIDEPLMGALCVSSSFSLSLSLFPAIYPAFQHSFAKLSNSL